MFDFRFLSDVVIKSFAVTSPVAITSPLVSISNKGVVRLFIVGNIAFAVPWILNELSVSSIPIAHEASPCSVNEICGLPAFPVLIITSPSLAPEAKPK
jgi:hypothetical protein